MIIYLCLASGRRVSSLMIGPAPEKVCYEINNYNLAAGQGYVISTYAAASLFNIYFHNQMTR